jgi:hypothetical protein
VVYVLVFLYLYWYLAECIRDSSDGWVRAPSGMGGLPELTDMITQMVNIIGCLTFYLLPATIFIIIAGLTNIIAWLLIIAALFFYPMGLLSVVLFNSVSGLDPRVLINSIRDIFWPYLGLVILFTIIILLVFVYMAAQVQPFWKMIFLLFMIYFAFILAHLAGRFYFKYKDKLKWKIPA